VNGHLVELGKRNRGDNVEEGLKKRKTKEDSGGRVAAAYEHEQKAKAKEETVYGADGRRI